MLTSVRFKLCLIIFRLSKGARVFYTSSIAKAWVGFTQEWFFLHSFEKLTFKSVNGSIGVMVQSRIKLGQ